MQNLEVTDSEELVNLKYRILYCLYGMESA